MSRLARPPSLRVRHDAASHLRMAMHAHPETDMLGQACQPTHISATACTPLQCTTC